MVHAKQFDLIPYVISQRVPDSDIQSSNLTLEQVYDHVANQMVFSLRKELLRGTIKNNHSESVEFPATWFEHFKETHFPQWLLRRFPVRYRTHHFHFEKVIHVCPHSNVAFPGRPHLEFLEQA